MDQKEQDFKKFAKGKPELTILTDHALEPEEAYIRDNFNLRYWMGPVYDIIRHKDTHTPMSVAIYGDWGAGKTTAMRWLHGLINEWNNNDEAEIKIRPIWFYPWKYDKKEDVWRGLIAEVILNVMGEKIKDAKTAIRAFKMLSIFIGKSALDIVSAAKFGIPGFAELNSSVIKKIIKSLKETSHPEEAYLHPYEKALEKWVNEAIGKRQRIIIFIDDLDRCMPEIALQVLEALKLYLNIDGLIFIVGVDRVVINKVVEEHYRKIGFEPEKEIDKEKIGKYLAKMFQVEISLYPSEKQIEDFLNELLEGMEYWKEHLDQKEREIYRKIILKRAKKNPREIKRLINSAFMGGVGALKISGE
jgi:predicted KAP-like P-loop ATPase